MQTQHGRIAEGINSWEVTTPDKEPRMYRMAFPNVGGSRNYLVEGCPGRAVMRMLMQVSFFHLHVQDNVVILEKGTPPPTHGDPSLTCWRLGVL